MSEGGNDKKLREAGMLIDLAKCAAGFGLEDLASVFAEGARQNILATRENEIGRET